MLKKHLLCLNGEEALFLVRLEIGPFDRHSDYRVLCSVFL